MGGVDFSLAGDIASAGSSRRALVVLIDQLTSNPLDILKLLYSCVVATIMSWLEICLTLCHIVSIDNSNA